MVGSPVWNVLSALSVAAPFALLAPVALAQQPAPAPAPAAAGAVAPGTAAQTPAPAAGTAAPATPGGRQPSVAQQAQQERMRTCNATASERTLKAQARQTFMSACLAGKSDQQTMMRVCNAQASQDKLAGDARRTYMSTCLKSS